ATGRASKPRARSRSRSPNATDGEDRRVGVAVRPAAVSRQKASPPGAPGRAAAMRLALVAALGVVLAGCSASLLQVGAPPGSLPGAPKQAQQAPQPLPREHQRILAAYNGAYDDAALESRLNEMVARLVAASERPDVQYRVTILNSAAVNAFALPTGQLYVTRGLIALANDDAELASVLAHEMSHVIASHATMREEEARQVALVTRVFTDLSSDPETSALALAKSKIK